MPEKKKGIDISVWQGNIDAGQIKNSGIEFVILREGYSQSADSKFFENVKKCKEVGLAVMGVYHFSYALNADQAKQEARSCIANLQKAGLDKDTIVFFDFEYDTVTKAAASGVTLGRAECNAHTKAFCETVESLGYKAGVYFNIDYYRNWYDHDLLEKYVKWLADWSGDADYPCHFHQYSSKGSVPGINGNVDMNYYFVSDDSNSVTEVEFVERLVKPGTGNKYYIRKASGGYSDAIKGSPADSECDVLANCVGYAYGRFNEIGGWGSCKYLSPVNAENFMQYKGTLEVSQTPQLGACMVWQKGASLSGSDGAGHVAIVERVISDTEILTSESGYGSSKPFWTQIRKKGNGNWGQASGYKFLGFILNPAPCCKGTNVILGTMAGGSVASEIVHVVTKGETLSGIAAEYGTTYQKLATYNGISNPNLIVVGQKIRIPGATGSTDANGTPKKTTDEVAREVIDGKWGNGDARKTALTEAGYNFSEVQGRVNILVSASKKSVDAVAREVIQGKWGNGEDRKNRLTKAGYDYYAIQSRVNELM